MHHLARCNVTHTDNKYLQINRQIWNRETHTWEVWSRIRTIAKLKLRAQTPAAFASACHAVQLVVAIFTCNGQCISPSNCRGCLGVTHKKWWTWTVSVNSDQNMLWIQWPRGRQTNTRTVSESSTCPLLILTTRLRAAYNDVHNARQVGALANQPANPISHRHPNSSKRLHSFLRSYLKSQLQQQNRTAHIHNTHTHTGIMQCLWYIYYTNNLSWHQLQDGVNTCTMHIIHFTRLTQHCTAASMLRTK